MQFSPFCPILPLRLLIVITHPARIYILIPTHTAMAAVQNTNLWNFKLERLRIDDCLQLALAKSLFNGHVLLTSSTYYCRQSRMRQQILEPYLGSGISSSDASAVSDYRLETLKGWVYTNASVYVAKSWYHFCLFCRFAVCCEKAKKVCVSGILMTYNMYNQIYLAIRLNHQTFIYANRYI